MEVILRANATDDEMVDIVTTRHTGNFHKREILWGVVHRDFIYSESVMMDELMIKNGEITVTLEIKL